MQGGGPVRLLLLSPGVPPAHRPRRPLRGAVAVAVVAGVRGALPPESDREVGAGGAERVVVARVHRHVGLRPQVTGDTRGALAALLVEVVLAAGEALGLVARRADVVSPDLDLLVVGVVAVRAGDALRVHPALEERAPVVDLVPHLAVGVVEPVLEEGRAVRLREELPGAVLLGQEPPPGVAAGAGLHLEPRLEELRGPRDPALVVHLPLAAAPLGEADDEARLPLRRLPPRLRPLRPLRVARPRAVTGLAGDVDLGEGRLEPVLGEVVALAQVRRVALRALGVPVLRGLRPVQHVAVVHALARVEMEPTLPAFLLRPAIPGHGERLVASPRQLDQVLLQRDEAEDVRDRVVRQPPVGAVGADEGPAVLPEEARGHALVGEPRVAEVAEDRPVVRLLHRQVVVRAAPAPGLFGVARGARARADVRQRRGGGRGLPRGRKPEDHRGRRRYEGEGHQQQQATTGGGLHGATAVSACASGSRCRRSRTTPRPSAG